MPIREGVTRHSILSMIKEETLTDGTIAMWQTGYREETALVYHPPTDKTKRFYNSP